LAKIGVFRRKFRCKLAEIGEKLAFFGVNFILQKFCLCKKNDKYEVCTEYFLFFYNDTFLLYSMYCRAARIVAALQPGCEEMERE